MPLKKEEKEYIVNQVVEILKSPEKDKLIASLKEKVFQEENENKEESMDEVVYAVIQAIDELYG